MSIKIKSFSDITFDNVVNHIFKIEGEEYTNAVNDNGGETKWGITKTKAEEFKSLWSKYKWNGDMRTLPQGLAKDIYRIGFWEKMRCQDIVKTNPFLAYCLFDMGVNTNHSVAATNLQRILNAMNNEQKLYKDIKVDGGIGNITLATLSEYNKIRGEKGKSILVNTFIGLWSNRYLSIAENNETQEKWMYGWSDRAFSASELYFKLRDSK